MTYTGVTKMASNSQVLADLKSMMKDQQAVSLLNVFKGVPVICTAQVQDVSDNRAVFSVAPPESTSLMWERYTWLQSAKLLEAVKARVLSFDILSGVAELSDFQFAGSRLGERSAVRVEPKETLRVSINAQSQSIVGTMADISTIGVGIYVYHLENEHPFRRAAEVTLVMRLPKNEVNIQGKVRSLVRLSDFHRVSINFLPDQPENAAIAAYIVSRREEILNELPQLYEELRRSKSTGS
jgi:hypothetical protein